jgi:hypothetical protein
MSKTIKIGRRRRKRVVHQEGDRLIGVCQDTVCHEAPYHSSKWIGADEGLAGYIVCDLHGVLLGMEKGSVSRGGEYSCVFCECCRGTCAPYSESCHNCDRKGKQAEEEGR